MTANQDKSARPADHPIFSTEDLVRACYRAILRREPENEAVLKNAAYDSPEAIMSAFLQSSEFGQNRSVGGYLETVMLGHKMAAIDVETDVSPEVMMRLFERIRGQWSHLGETEPYWSVITNDSYRMENFAQHRAQFERSGQDAITKLKNAVRRAGVNLPAGQCFELGCGVGRVTRHLATNFDRVIGADVASGNLRICSEYLTDAGVDNVELKLLTAIEQLADLPEFDLFYSVIVLQHNPPPVIKYILKMVLEKIRPGGMAYFQVPTHAIGYGFKGAEYLKAGHQVMEMHALPMPEVLDCLLAAKLVLREVIADDATGHYGSHTFLAVKPAA